jgi:hypothetical protein
MEHTALRTRLAELLREAERAHVAYEKQLGRRDENWPDWYAAYIAERLSGDSR